MNDVDYWKHSRDNARRNLDDAISRLCSDPDNPAILAEIKVFAKAANQCQREYYIAVREQAANKVPV